MAISLIPNFRFSASVIDNGKLSVANGLRGRAVQAFADRLYLSDGGAFLITGYRGVGKTTFVQDALKCLKENLKAESKEGGERVLLDVCINIARPITGVELMHGILRQLYSRLGELQLLRRLPKPLHSQIKLAFLRTSAMLAFKNSEESEAGISIEKWLSFSSKITHGYSRDLNYLAYDERSAENDLIALAQKLSHGFTPRGPYGLPQPFAHPLRLKLLFVFDELDKIDEAKGSIASLTEILQTLKTLFTTSGISFIFVAGRSLHERWLQDVQRGDSVFESVFSESRYLPAVWNQVDDLCDPFLANIRQLSDYDRQLYTDFKRYLAFTGRGIPRRIIRGFHERVRWDGECATLALSENDRRQMRFHAELYQLLSQSEAQVLGENSRELRPDWLDKQRLGIYYILDWVLARGTAAFTLAEIIDAASNELTPGIAPARELAPRVVTGLIDLLCINGYLEKFTDINETLFNKPGLTQQREKFRLLPRRLIEMGCQRDIEPTRKPATETAILSGRYQLMELIGQGASAQVFRALDRMTGRIVAVKRFNAHFFSTDSTLQERLREEVSVQFKLHHSGIAEMLDVDFDDDTPFIVIEYLDGVTLHRMLEEHGSLPVAEAMTIMRALLDTLHYLHNHGVIWRDVKPANILLTLQGRVVIVDFGTAQTVQNASEGPDTTRLGFAAGTPAYMSPEQVRGEMQTAASDLFSLGVILFEMLSGEKPWPVNSPVEYYQRVMSEKLDTLVAFQRIPENFRPFLRKCLNLEPEERFQSAEEMLGALPHTEPDQALVHRIAKTHQMKTSPVLSGGYTTMAMKAPVGESVSIVTKSVSEPSPASVAPAAPAPFRASPAQAVPVSSPVNLSIPPVATPISAPVSAPISMPSSSATDSTAPGLDFITPLRPCSEISPGQLTHPRGYALLTLRETEGERYFGLFGARIMLGRAVDCDIQLRDSQASRYHASIHREEGQYFIEDMNSSNGLQVNQKRIYQRQALRDQDVVTIGKTTLTFSAPEVQLKSAVTAQTRTGQDSSLAL